MAWGTMRIGRPCAGTQSGGNDPKTAEIASQVGICKIISWSCVSCPIFGVICRQMAFHWDLSLLRLDGLHRASFEIPVKIS